MILSTVLSRFTFPSKSRYFKFEVVYYLYILETKTSSWSDSTFIQFNRFQFSLFAVLLYFVGKSKVSLLVMEFARHSITWKWQSVGWQEGWQQSTCRLQERMGRGSCTSDKWFHPPFLADILPVRLNNFKSPDFQLIFFFRTKNYMHTPQLKPISYNLVEFLNFLQQNASN